MSIHLSPTDRDRLQRLVTRPKRPTARQKALALLTLAEGGTREEASIRAGIPKDDVSALETGFAERGLGGIGLLKPRLPKMRNLGRVRVGTVEKIPGVCGASACIAGTRIPVWQLVEARDLGVSEAQLLIDYPSLRALNLVEAWQYAKDNPDEIAAEIHKHEVA